MERVGARLRCVWSALAAALLLVAAAGSARAVDPVQAAQGPPLQIALFVSSRNDVCHDPGDIPAIRRFAAYQQRQINLRGGVAGRPLMFRVFDDERSDAKAIANMRAALSEPHTIGLIGLSNSARAKAVFDALGDDIAKSGIPFLTDISVGSIFERYKNVYTTRPSQDEERAPVMGAFVRAMGFKKPAFVGTAKAVFSEALGDSIKKLHEDGTLVADHRIPANDGQPDAAALERAVADLVAQQPDVLYVALGSKGGALLMERLKAAGLMPPLFVSGRLDTLPPEASTGYSAPLYQLAWENLPDVFNSRMRELAVRSPGNPWVFEGKKIKEAPGWAKGECKERDDPSVRDPFEAANLRAISTAARYADMMALIARTVRRMPRETDIGALRDRVTTALSSDYAVGRGAFRGTFENWSFDPILRTAARTPFILMRPHTLGRLQLAPIQFRRTRDGNFDPISTLYADIDLIKAHRVDDSGKAFIAEFYLAIRNNTDLGVEKIEFANAFIDPSSQGRHITIETVHGGGRNGMFPPGMKIYKVVGRFLFEPKLAEYPFDTQTFSIDLQPKSGNASFIVQPPPSELRDRRVQTDGWEPVEQYVGFSEEFVPLVDSFTHQASMAPFYSASFVWQMRRETTDYFLRVVVPLAFILSVAYLGYFIPLSRFDSIVAIQVTALLSAVALYISLPKIDADRATLSDRIFLFDYLMVSIMIAITILRINPVVEGRRWMRGTLAIAHIAVIPLIVAAAAFYVYTVSIAGR
jgi:hypothetical protein